MDLEERPLLHFADLTLALLRVSCDHDATIADAVRRLSFDRAVAHEPQAVDAHELAYCLNRARRHLLAARMMEMLDDSRFRITPRGRAVLRAHPDGIDDSVLVEFPEFRAWMHRISSHPPPEDARPREFQRGWSAQAEGQELTENPYAPETAQHAAWDDGWLEGQRQCGGPG